MNVTSNGAGWINIVTYKKPVGAVIHQPCFTHDVNHIRTTPATGNERIWNHISATKVLMAVKNGHMDTWTPIDTSERKIKQASYVDYGLGRPAQS